ncbi:MAG: hypothetical protein DRO15_04485 [Thermoprotei archaeon]|nr:MAG: hypothetical protein DRO15_04485 [Thermoprotei archaeon]
MYIEMFIGLWVLWCWGVVLSKWNDLYERIVKVLKPRGDPIGFKLFKSEEEARKIGSFTKVNIALCQAIKLASSLRAIIIANSSNIDACVIGTYVLGFKELPQDLAKRWIEAFGYTEELFKKLIESIHALPLNSYRAAVFAPIDRFNRLGVEPDGVILIVNSLQAYLALIGYFDSTGHKPSSDFNGHAVCEIIATIMKNKSPWLTIPCGGARALAEVQDDELWLGMKVDQVERTIKRLEEVGLIYPPPIYQKLWTPPLEKHPLTHLIARKS